MIPVQPIPEPPEFIAVAARGNRWLAEHPERSARPPDSWRRFLVTLREGFANRCGYLALWDQNGTVDHFVSIREDRTKAYDWTNYRYATGWVNSSKQSVDSAALLDPFEVREGWFEVLLPTMELVVTELVPPELLDRARTTLRRLPLGRDQRAIKRRETYFDLYRAGDLSLEGLRRMAPLVALAVEKAGLLPQPRMPVSR